MNQILSDIKLPCTPAEADNFISTPGATLPDCVRNISGSIMVLGAGGKMGYHLCLMLANARRQIGSTESVIAVSRFASISSSEDFTAQGIQVISGDLRDPDFLNTLPECPVVFFLAGAKFGTSQNPELLDEMNVRVPQLVAERYKHSRVVVFSTGCVYPFVTPDNGGADEKCPVKPNGAYAESCLKREKMFQQGAVQYKTPVVLIRLNYSVEFRYGVLVDIAQKVLNDEPVDVTMGYVNVIWQGDAIDQIIRCVGLASSPAVPVNITGAEILSVRSIALGFSKMFDKPVSFTGEEAATAWLSNASYSHRCFGKPSTSVRQMMEWIAAWLANGLPTHGKPTGFEKRDGNF